MTLQSEPPVPTALDLGLHLPTTWRRRSDPDRGVIVAARASVVPLSGRRPELTLRGIPIDDDLLTWRGAAMADLARRLEDFALEVADDFDLFGHDVAYRRFAFREVAYDVLCDQWAWVVGGAEGELGITLTCSVAREEYADFCDLFETIAESIDLDGLVA